MSRRIAAAPLTVEGEDGTVTVQALTLAEGMTVGPPCSWPVSYASCNDCSALAGLTPEEKAFFEGVAAEYLWRWTGQAFGECEVTIRPCRTDCDGPSTFWGDGPYPWPGGQGSGGGWVPFLVGGQWYNVRCGSCSGGCSCAGGPETLILPGPVSSIVEIVQDGEVVPAAAYRVDDYRMLVRLDGQPWPGCQDFSAAPTEPGTWQVTYTKGRPVPSGGSLAAGVLACELAKAACGDPTCGLPQRMQTVTRQGVTVAVLDTFEDVEKGRTGIWLVDSWVTSIMNTPRPSTVRSVDIPRGRNRRTTWPRG